VAHLPDEAAPTPCVAARPVPAIVTLLTDFGLADTYVGQVKGAILAVAPGATLVDLSHGVEPQDVRGGAFLLWAAVGAFPPGTIHLAVVDPGVGSGRRALAARSAGGHLLVGPDNGLLGPALDLLGGAIACVELSVPRYWRPRPSATFHGRDIFGPVAGHLAAGASLEALGPPATVSHPFRLPTPELHGEQLVGEVVHVDRYGNLVTNLRADTVAPGGAVAIAGRRVERRAHYAAAAPGGLLALEGSAGLIEISARDGSAAAPRGVTRGARVTAARWR